MKSACPSCSHCSRKTPFIGFGTMCQQNMKFFRSKKFIFVKRCKFIFLYKYQFIDMNKSVSKFFKTNFFQKKILKKITLFCE